MTKQVEIPAAQDWACTDPDCASMGGFYAGTGAKCWGHQSADGAPSAWYYDREYRLGFSWNGLQPYIEVSVEGFGEPVYYRIEVEPTGGKVSLPVFASVCQEWVVEVYEPALGRWDQ